MNLNYNSVFLIIIFSFLLSLIICLASIILSNNIPDNEKVSAYECGFDPFHSPGEPFSISFFLIAILFLVFDLEISYLFPWSCASNIISINGHMIVILFILVLVVGLIYEWMNGGLEWE